MWSTSTEPRRRLAVCVALLALLPYLNVLLADFTFDDLGVIRENPMITGVHTSAMQLFTTVDDRGALYRPLTMLTYLAQTRLGCGATSYHMVNVLLHVLVSVMVLRLAWRLLGSGLGAAASAALFAVHPIHTEAVSSIVGRAELLAALLTLISLLALIRATQETGPRHAAWLALSCGVLSLGLLSKESGFVAIPLCGIVYVWMKPCGARRAALLMSLYVLLGMGYLALRILVVGSLALPVKPDMLDNPLAHVPPLPRLETAVVILWQYLAQLAAPLVLSADYSFNQIPIVASVLDARFLAASALFGGVTVGLAASYKRAPALLLAAAFIVVPLAVTANVLFPIGTIKAERLLYLPSFGWCLGCAWLLTRTPKPQRRWWLALFAIVVTACAGRTWVRNRDWQNNFTLFRATVQTSPRSAKAHHNLAVAYEERGDIDAAMLHFREALALYPPYEWAAFGIGKMYEEKGIDTGALDWYATATKLNWHLALAHLNTGAIRYKRSELAAAEAAFRAGLEAEPDNPRLLIGLSMARLAQGDRDTAQATLMRVESMADGDPSIAQPLADARRALAERTVR